MRAETSASRSPSRLAAVCAVAAALLVLRTSTADGETAPETAPEPAPSTAPVSEPESRTEPEDEQGGAVISARLRRRLPRGWTSRIPPASPEETADPDVAEAIRSAPPAPPEAEPYEGRGGSMRQARRISRLVPRRSITRWIAPHECRNVFTPGAHSWTASFTRFR